MDSGLARQGIDCDTFFITKEGIKLGKHIIVSYPPTELAFNPETEQFEKRADTDWTEWEPAVYGVARLVRQLKEHDTHQTTIASNHDNVRFALSDDKQTMNISIILGKGTDLGSIHTNNLRGIGETHGAVTGHVKRSVHYHFDKRFLGGRDEDDLITAALRKIEDCNAQSGEVIQPGEHITLVYVCEIIMAGGQGHEEEQGFDTSGIGGSQSSSESRMGRHAMSAYRCDLAVALSKGNGKKLQKLQEQAPPGTGAAVGALTPATPTAGAEAHAAYGLDKFATLSLAERASQYTTACARLQEHHKKRPGDIAAHMDTYVSYISPMADHIPKALHKGARDIFA